MIELRYTLELDSPLRVGTGIGLAGYLDNTIARNRRQQAVVPGSSIKGKSRAMVARLCQALEIRVHPYEATAGCLATTEPCLLCRVFGAAQWPSGLHFSDAELHPDLKRVLAHLDEAAQNRGRPVHNARNFGRQIRASTALDRRRRTVLRDRLFTHEAVQSPAQFVGQISGHIVNMRPDGAEAVLLATALEAVTHLGGGRGRGTGRCRFTVTEIIVNGTAIAVTDRSQLLSTFTKGEPRS